MMTMLLGVFRYSAEDILSIDAINTNTSNIMIIDLSKLKRSLIKIRINSKALLIFIYVCILNFIYKFRRQSL